MDLCSEVYLLVFYIKHSASVSDIGTAIKLPTSGEAEKEWGEKVTVQKQAWELTRKYGCQVPIKTTEETNKTKSWQIK